MKRISEVTGTGVPLLIDDIDTDRIIPARYLRCVTFDGLGEHAFEDDRLQDSNHPFDDPRFQGGSILVTGRNFGCGSSREHAPAAMQIAGVQAVVAESFARIFYRNTVDGGFLVPLECTEPLLPHFSTHDEAVIDLENSFIYNKRTQRRFALRPLGQVEAIVRAGGIFEYARKTGMIGGTHHVQER